MTIEERQEAAKWFQNRASHTSMPGAKMMFKRAAEALSEGMQPQWIPCSERLPEVSKDPYFIDEIDGAMLFEGERVLVFGKNEDGYDYAVATNIYSTAMGNEWSGAYDAAENELTQILAWMPLPKWTKMEGEDDEHDE